MRFATSSAEYLTFMKSNQVTIIYKEFYRRLGTCINECILSIYYSNFFLYFLARREYFTELICADIVNDSV